MRPSRMTLAMPIVQLARCWRTTSQTLIAPVLKPSTSAQVVGVLPRVNAGWSSGPSRSCSDMPQNFPGGYDGHLDALAAVAAGAAALTTFLVAGGHSFSVI